MFVFIKQQQQQQQQQQQHVVRADYTHEKMKEQVRDLFIKM